MSLACRRFDLLGTTIEEMSADTELLGIEKPSRRVFTRENCSGQSFANLGLTDRNFPVRGDGR
jgi:hypothetical protein